MPLSPDQGQRVLASIASGSLRLDAPTKMYAGYGTGRTCVGCDEVIDATQVEYEADFPDGAAYRLHLGCASLLDAERRRAQRLRSAQEQAPATLDKAQQVSKESAQARDRADVLAREAEAIREESRRVRRREQVVGEGVVDHADALAKAVLSHQPDVHCFACLAPQIGITEKIARDAAQVLLVRDGFLIERRVCATCGKVEIVLVVKTPWAVSRGPR